MARLVRRLLPLTLMGALPAAAGTIPLDAPMAHITFDGRAPTRYRSGPEGLEMAVSSSSSFLLQKVEPPQRARRLRFRYRLRGARQPSSSMLEEQKAGDDHVLRIGLLLRGEAPSLPFFMPAWLKRARDTLAVPAGSMLTVIAGSHHAPGTRWASPFASEVVCVAAVEGPPDADGWRQASLALPDVEVVGLWLMADGDATGSSFQTTLGGLELLASP